MHWQDFTGVAFKTMATTAMQLAIDAFGPHISNAGVELLK
jgi:Na+/H+-translocating membrane pyrophosphatase